MLSGETILYSSSMVGLNYLWYKDYEHSSFHFFDDSKEWLQVDKAGHFYTSYYFNKILSSGFKWSGVKDENAVLFGSGMSFVFISTIEVFDGFSEKWGASWSDMAANTGGIILYSIQEKVWNEQRLVPKFSFSQSRYAQYRPDALGNNFIENLIKDYNGQTYWLSCNINSFAKIDGFPDWLNIAFGYGADGMLGGMDNNIDNYDNCGDNLIYYVKRNRQYYFSLDIDLTKIKTKRKGLKFCFEMLNSLKIPFSAIEINQNSTRFHPLFF